MDSTEADVRNIGLICIGFVPGFLFVMGISPEREMLLPFFGNVSYFELIVAIVTIVGLLVGVLYLISELQQISAGVGSFVSSFLSGYLMATAMNRGMDIFLILVGLAALFIAFILTIPAFET